MRGYGKYGRGAKSLSLAEALYGPAAATKESAPLLEIQEESTTSGREAPAAHGEEDLRLELRSARGASQPGAERLLLRPSVSGGPQ